MTYFSILLGFLWELFFTFSLWVLDGQLFTENSEIEVFEPDTWELIIEDSEITLLLCINEYWGRELFIYFCIDFSSKPFEDWDCALRDLPFASFNKHSFRRFPCSTRVTFSQETKSSSLIFYLQTQTIALIIWVAFVYVLQLAFRLTSRVQQFYDIH